MAWTIGSPYAGLNNPTLSPDGRKVAFSARQGYVSDIWVRDLVRGIDTKLTFGAGRKALPTWMSPSRLCYMEIAGVTTRTLAVNADGSGAEAQVAASAESASRDIRFAPDGKTAALIVDDRGQGRLRIASVLADGSLGPQKPLLRRATRDRRE